MSSSRRIRRDDFDIESIETFHDRGDNYKSRSSGSRTRSRSRKRSYSRRTDNSSRSRSRSLERKKYSHSRRRRDSYSRSRSRSRSRDHSRRSDRRKQASRRYHDSRSRSPSRSRSRSRSQSYSRHQQSERYRYRRHDDYEKRNGRRSRSRSRSLSQYRNFAGKMTENQNQSLHNRPSRSALANGQDENTGTNDANDDLEDLPLPQQKSDEMYQFEDTEPIDRARIHREMEEKLRATLAKEGKVYPPPKSEASHPVFANDGSFLEIFKKMQQAQASTSKAAVAVAAPSAATPTLASVPPIVATANPSTAPYLAAAAVGKSAPPPPILGRRKGGKILKTGVVAKPKVQTDTNADPKDFWSLYLAEVNKYKNTACESEQGNRPLVK